MDATGPHSRPATTAAEPSDEALASELARGDGDALRALHRRYAPVLFRAARRALDAAAAEDIVQDVFVQVWRHGATFDPARGTFRAWVSQIARARVLNELRRRRRRPALDPGAAAELDALADGSPAPDEAAWREYRRAALERAVDELPAAQRRALSLAFLEEMPHEQVAASLALPLGTAKTRIRAGLKGLRLALAPLLLLALVALLARVVRRGADDREARARDERALGAMTSSDLEALRLVAPGAAPVAPGSAAALAQRHATYRARPGDALAVVTYTSFASAPPGAEYVAWARHGARWTRLGAAQPDARGRALFIAEGAALAARPDALEVTVEPAASARLVPRGPVVVAWPAAAR